MVDTQNHSISESVDNINSDDEPSDYDAIEAEEGLTKLEQLMDEECSSESTKGGVIMSFSSVSSTCARLSVPKR